MPKAESEIDYELVKDLKRSRHAIGELPVPILKDQNGRIIAGRHRTEAGFKRVIVVPVKSDLDFYVKKLSLTIQRRSSFAEHVNLITRICEELEKQDIVRKNEIANYLMKHFSPFGNKKYVYSMIPDKYKQERPSRQVHTFPEVEKSSVRGVFKLPSGLIARYRELFSEQEFNARLREALEPTFDIECTIHHDILTVDRRTRKVLYVEQPV